MDDSQLREYLPVLMLGCWRQLSSFGMLVLSVLLGKKGKRSPSRLPLMSAACCRLAKGIPPFGKILSCGDAVILFDVKLCFCIVGGDLQGDAQSKMQIDLVPCFPSSPFLLVGYIYAVKKGLDDWKS